MSEAWWSVQNARTIGFYKGKELDMNAENLTMLDKANNAWVKWAKDNNIDAVNTAPETYKLMSEAFIDGYLKGFAKRLTEGA